MSYRLIAAAAAAIALQGCAAKAPVAPGTTENLNEGIANTCTASPIDLSASASANASITMSNDGWCAVKAVEKDGQPFQLGLVRQRPEHGRVLIHKIGGQTRVDYTPDTGYTGADRFTVALRSRNAAVPDAMVQVAVNVGMGAGMATPAAAPAAAPAPTAAPPRPAPHPTKKRAPAHRAKR